MSKPTVYYTVGLPGSGKTTWAYQMQEKLCKRGEDKVVLVAMDDIRKVLNVQFNKDNEFLCRRIWASAIRGALSLNYSVIVHDSNLNSNWIDTIKKIAENFQDVAVIEQSFLHVPLQTCIERNSQRPDGERIPAGAIARMYEKWVMSKG